MADGNIVHAYRKNIMWFVAALFFFLEYFARVSPSVMVDDLMSFFSLDGVALGTLASFFYYPYVIMQIPVGAMVDRFGPKYLLVIMATVFSLSCFVFGSSQSYWVAELSRCFMGFAGSFAFVGALKIVTLWFPSHSWGLFAGLTQGLGMLGAAGGLGPLSWCVVQVGWRNTMFLLAAAIAFVAFLIMVCVSHKGGNTTEDDSTDRCGMWSGFRIVLASPFCWLNALFAGFLYAPTEIFAELWGVNFIQYGYGVSHVAAGFAVSMIFIGWACGAPLQGWLISRIKMRTAFMAVISLMCLGLFSFIVYVPMTYALLLICTFFYGMCNAGVVISYTLAAAAFDKRYAGVSMAFTNMMSVVIGSLGLPLVGKCLDLQWGGILKEGVRMYSHHAYLVAFFVPLILLCVSTLCAVILTCKSHMWSLKQSIDS